MRNKTFAIFVLTAILLGAVFVTADSNMDFSAATSIIQQKTPCSQLSQTQLIEVGDYYMQLMLGSAHDQMDAMMGGDNATMDEQMHLYFAERYYCNGIYPDQINSSSGYGYRMMYGYGGYYRTPFMYYLPWILLALVVGAGIAVAIVLANKNNRNGSSRDKRRK